MIGILSVAERGSEARAQRMDRFVSTFTNKIDAKGRNPINGAPAVFVSDVTMMRKSGRWVIEDDNWRAVD